MTIDDVSFTDCEGALRPFLEQLEVRILALAGVQFDPRAESGALRAVS